VLSEDKMTDILIWLQEYYLSLCDGDWEHSYGFKIDNLDNPGWKLEFDLKDTAMEGQKFSPITIDRTEDDWVRCRVEENFFRAYGGPLNLAELLTIFRDWVEKTKANNSGDTIRN
jgi:hypothetical protein